MPSNKADDLESVLVAVPITIYKIDEKSYPWPKSNRCIFCLVGKFNVVPPNILVCKVCKSEFHMPFLA